MRCRWIRAVCLAAVVIGACHSSKSQPGIEDAAPEPPPVEPRDATPPGPRVEGFDTQGKEERDALRELGAEPVWDVVVDRGEYLARRGKQGVIYGRLGASIDGYRWLIDDTEGAGSLGIRLDLDRFLDPSVDLPVDQRVLVWGAWHVDDELRWYWEAERVARLGPREREIPPEVLSEPGHVIVDIDSPPEGAVPVSERARGPGDIIFEVTRSPADPADGWEIGDPGSRQPVARLRLPGERRSYGAQDYRTADEHWHLERRVRYVVRVRHFMPAKPGELIYMRALNAPRRLVEPE